MIIFYAVSLNSPALQVRPVAAATITPDHARYSCDTVPVVTAWSAAFPGDTIFLVGSGFTDKTKLQLNSLDESRKFMAGARWTDKRYLLATLPTSLHLGPLTVRAGHGDCWSRSFLLDAPSPWWVWPSVAHPGSSLRVFGTNLDHGTVSVQLEAVNGNNIYPLSTITRSPYTLQVGLSADLPKGRYRLWLQLRSGDTELRTGPVSINVASTRAQSGSYSVNDVSGLLRALGELTNTGGGTIRIAAGRYKLDRPLHIPSGVQLQGAGSDNTVLQFGPVLMMTPGLVKQGGTYSKTMTMPDPVPGKQGRQARAAVLLFDSRSGLNNLAIDGGGVAELGIAVAGTRTVPVSQISLHNLVVQHLAPFRPRFGQTEAILARHVSGLEVSNSELMGNGPALFLEDVAGSSISGNRLSGQGNAVIIVREGGLRHSIIENNRILSKKDGAPQAVRMLWLSNLFGSSYGNYIAGNVGTDFHPPPGTDQNRGEAILLESALSHPYFGRLDAASSGSVTLPQDGPDWSMLDSAPNLRGTPLDAYFVIVVDGSGQGQVRRIVSRQGRKLLLNRPWRVIPNSGSTVVLSELFYHNLIVGNDISDALTGVQLWVNGVRNVIAGNQLSNFKREGVLLYSMAVGGPQNKPPFWPILGHNRAGFNRGIGLSFFNRVDNNHISNSRFGISISARDMRAILSDKVTWPVSMGNSVRDNRVEKAQQFGLWTGLRGKWGTPPVQAPGSSLLGNIFEDNNVIDTADVFGCDAHASGIVFRHNRTLAAGITSYGKPTISLNCLHKPSVWQIKDNQ